MTRHWFTIALMSACMTTPAQVRAQPAQAVHLRPIDRATVRIISLGGIAPAGADGRRTHVRRIVGRAVTTHGSGVVVGPSLVLTARHVVSGADAWIVVPAGSSEPMAARPIYVDLDHDIAFVVVDGVLPHRLPLPTAARALTLSEPVSVSGYPLDLREYTPAATSGEVSRITRNGELHLTMTVNPGHSGGPVIDAQGQLVGIVSARGRIDRGVEGLTIAVPIGPIRSARARVPDPRPHFDDEARDFARGIAWVSGLGARPLLDDREEIQRVLQHAGAWTTVDADRDAVLATLAWNTLVESLEAENAADLSSLPASAQPAAQLLQRTALQLARRAVRTGPQVRRRFPIVRAISIGRVQPHPPTRTP